MTQVLGSMRKLDDTRGTVRVEDVYDTDIDDLWSALTERDRLSRWIATVDGDLRLGGDITLHFTSTWEGPARVTVCDKPHRILLTIEPDTVDEAEIEAWLTPEGGGTRLVVEDRGLPLDTLHNYGAGWQAHLDDLRRYLGGGESAWQERWEELAPVYKELGLS